MTATDPIDDARLGLLLGDLRLPAIRHIWPRFAERADKEGWPAARFLATPAEPALAERSRRRIERHLTEARLPPGKTLDAFDFDVVPPSGKQSPGLFPSPRALQGPGYGAGRRALYRS